MPLTVHFVRHGESHANRLGIFANRIEPPFALTDAGIEQARVVADLLVGATHMYASPLLRARQTAERIASARNIPIEITAALREYDVGAFEGLPYTGEHAWRWHEHLRVELAWRDGDLDARHPGGESATDISARFLPFMESLAARHGDTDSLVLVGHGGTYLTALPMLFEAVSIDDARRFGFGHCDVVTATWNGSHWTCHQWGEHRIGNPPP